MTDPLKPSLSLLCKIGSLIVHADELNSRGGHLFDRVAFDSLLSDAEVVQWIKDMKVYLPVKR